MIEADRVTSKRFISNQQLFSETYLRELRIGKFPHDAVNVCMQIICEWREVYPDLEDENHLRQYVGQCLSALHISYTPQQNLYLLYTDETKTNQTGICLIVNDIDLGSTIKGCHYQANLIKHLRSADLNWGMITNGKDWRLCYASSIAPYEVFLELDLDRLLQENILSEFLMFYLFFGQQAFTTAPSKDINVQKIGLDRYLEDSEKRIEAIQHYLRGQVEPILQSLCLGFVQDEAAGTYTRETLDEIYRNAIFLLYRILFLFYAEARELLPTQDTNYQQKGLAGIVEEARLYQQEGAHSPDPFSLWKQLTQLFVIVDDGDESVGVRPYNGGLFSDREKPYLKTHRITNAYLAPALFELGYVQGKAGIYPVEYCDLSVRHLGTIYEGLLEYRLNLVDQEPTVVRESKGNRVYIPMSQAGAVKRTETILEVGAVYFADDKGERKSSGSYYTPEDVVQYIVSNTILPKLQECRQPLETFLIDVQREMRVAANSDEYFRLERYADQESLKTVEHALLGLRILDPAMGSAHFLVAAGQVVTNFIVETLNMTEWANSSISSDPLMWKRRVVERCIYGVDLNLLAHELAKLALWLSSASAGKPLTFLDHHLKVGNSLYGTPLNRLSALPTTKNTGNQLLFQEIHEQTIRAVVEKLGGITRTDSDHIEDVKYKGEVNRSVIDFTQRLRDIAHVWLGTLFGLQNSNGQPLDEQEYHQLLEEVTRNYTAESWEIFVNSRYVLREARNLAAPEEMCFFHWELEFPDAVVDGKCQFDAIITNPPYVGTQPNKAIKNLFETAKCGDLYAWIFERALNARSERGSVGLVVPLSLMFGRSLAQLRQLLLTSHLNLNIAAFDNRPDMLFNVGTIGENLQRTTISIAQSSLEQSTVKTTDMLRWWSSDRPFLFRKLHFTDTTSHCSKLSFPRIGNDAVLIFWSRFKAMEHTLSDLCTEMFSETRRPAPDSIFLTVPRATGYFISATPGPMLDRNKVLSFSFKEKNDMDLARVLINSNIFYWYWRAFGDGFCLGVDLVGSFPIPNLLDNQYIGLAERLDSILATCTTFAKYRGERVPSYNFNQRMDVLINIDEWIVKQVAPDLDLPRDIFAQYKSNSFLRPLDLSAILGTEAEENWTVEE
jgi:hypothetical protein